MSVTQLSDKISQIERRMEEARRQGRQEERQFIIDVLTATKDQSTHPATRAGLRLAADLVKGLPIGNL